jgi:hypothetical protein
MNKPVTARCNVPFELTGLPIIGKTLSLFRRRTWTPNAEHWITDYGFELFGLAFWVHLPAALFPDGCCAHGEGVHPTAPEDSVPPLTPSMIRGMRSGLAHAIARPPEHLKDNAKAWEALLSAYEWARRLGPVVDEDGE